MSEEKLIAGLKCKDPRIQANFYNRWKRYLFSVAMMILKNRMDTEDVIQESFIKIFDSIGSFTPGNSLKGWMSVIVRNHAISFYNRNSRHNKTTMIEESEPMQKQASNFIESYLSRDIYNKALRELHHKSPNQYMYARLYFEEDMSRAEIAKDIDVPLGTVKSQVSRAASSLRAIINEY